MPAPPKDIFALTAKLNRAEQHIFKFKEFWDGFSTKAYPVGSKYDPDLGKHIYYLVGVVPVPVDVPLLAGDVIQNLRSSLDHLAHRLVCIGTQSPGPFDDVYFPIGKDRLKFESKLQAIEKRLTTNAAKALRSVEAYPGGEGEVLFCINEINNIDKHRLLLTVTAENRTHSMSPAEIADFRKSFFGISGAPPEAYDAIRFQTLSANPACDLKAGHILGSFSPNEVHDDMHFPVDVAFGEPDCVKRQMVLAFLYLAYEHISDLFNLYNSLGLFD